MLSEFLATLQQSKPLLGVTMILVYGLGTVLTMIGGEVRASWRDRQWRKDEQRGEREYAETSYTKDWPEEDSEEFTLTREGYLGHNLNPSWRERVRHAAEPVMEDTYVPSTWGQVNYQDTVQWPTWTEEQRAIPGRHRFDDTQVVEAIPISPGGTYTMQGLRALVTSTGAFPTVDRPRELIGVGS